MCRHRPVSPAQPVALTGPRLSRRRWPTVAGRPSRAAGCAGSAPRRRRMRGPTAAPGPAASAPRPERTSPRTGRRWAAAAGSRLPEAAERPAGRPQPERGPPRGAPSPGRSGRPGSAEERQYASWCASARGAGGDSAKHRWRWSGLVARASRSSPNATNGHAGAPSMPGSPRSVIGRMIPAGQRRRHPAFWPIGVVSIEWKHTIGSTCRCRDVSDADEIYLCRVVEDCQELLGDEIELRRLEVDANGEVVLRLSYRLGSADQTSEGQGQTVIAAHVDSRRGWSSIGSDWAFEPCTGSTADAQQTQASCGAV